MLILKMSVYALNLLLLLGLSLVHISSGSTENHTLHPACTPSSCGVNAICKEQERTVSCTCLPEYGGDPYVGCKPECILNSDCPFHRTCIRNKCQDPCPGSCGSNAECQVANHIPTCTCGIGYTGNPLTSCIPLEIEPKPTTPSDPDTNLCVSSPCGPNSECRRDVGGSPSCSCLSNYVGSPPNCRPECTINSECPTSLACIREKCTDPCLEFRNADVQCSVLNHTPICPNPEGTTGNSSSYCQPTLPPPRLNNSQSIQCVPSPCGPNSQCREINKQAVCSCLPNYIGSPPGCRPECTVNSECSRNNACVNQKCVDPCPGTCGLNANCQVINHSPICSCTTEYTGDPFSRCYPIPTPDAHPCVPSPCGPNSKCRAIGGSPSCSCLSDYVGSPPNCRPECTINSECPTSLACIREKCTDPCLEFRDVGVHCSVINHTPICPNPQENTGNSSSYCQPTLPPPRLNDSQSTPCVPSPCGPNSQCREMIEQAVCSCLPNYIGSPPGCRPECTLNYECSRNKACVNKKCVDPCPGTCGLNANCQVFNHSPICTCKTEYTGDPFSRCYPVPPPNANPCTIDSECPTDLACIREKCTDPCLEFRDAGVQCSVINHTPICPSPEGTTGNSSIYCPPTTSPPSLNNSQSTPCVPSPCGPYSQCREINEQAVCSCLPNHIGSPPSCRSKCTVNSECSRNNACVNQNCVDPCPGTCDPNANCQVINHSPICSCTAEYTGDPFSRCYPIPPPDAHLCIPSPCGPNSKCRPIGGSPSCSCLTNYTGSPPNCRLECTIDSECPTDLSCIREKCTDPCLEFRDAGVQCSVINHTPICPSTEETTGNLSIYCQPTLPPPRLNDSQSTPCVPSPCGPNSQCREMNEQPVCSCLPNYIGSPPSCRPECTLNYECSRNKACVNKKCVDPCPGTCGLNAKCQVFNHNPVCTCKTEYTGDPFSRCYPVPPPNANPCTIDSECPTDLACIREKCTDPCLEFRDAGVQCSVINHTPICPSPEGTTGNSSIYCPPTTSPPRLNNSQSTPCVPSPCGPYSQCREIYEKAVCLCLPNHIGSPPSCRSKCTVNSECSRNNACVNQNCVDPCPGTCGPNANCQVINHSPICSCTAEYTGDPFSRCFPIPPPDAHLCVPSPCGPNSKCRPIGGSPSCSCLTNYTGSPPNCRLECTIDSECPTDLSCIREKCTDPCLEFRDAGVQCSVINHTPICPSTEGTTGNSSIYCQPTLPPRDEPIDPCQPSPCGSNAECKLVGDQPSCSCLNDSIGQPPNCTRECIVNSDCSSNNACVNNKCQDPCPGSCGQNAYCQVINHHSICTCGTGYVGDPFVACKPIEPLEIEHKPLRRNIRSTLKNLIGILLAEKEATIITNCKLNGYPDIGPILQTAYDDMTKCRNKKRLFLVKKNDFLDNLEECSKDYITKVKGCLRDDQKYYPEFSLETKKAYNSMFYDHYDTVAHDLVRCNPKLKSIEAQRSFFQCITDINIKYNITSEIPSSKALQCRSHIPQVYCFTNMLRDNCDKTTGMDQFTKDYNNVMERLCET